MAATAGVERKMEERKAAVMAVGEDREKRLAPTLATLDAMQTEQRHALGDSAVGGPCEADGRK